MRQVILFLLTGMLLAGCASRPTASAPSGAAPAADAATGAAVSAAPAGAGQGARKLLLTEPTHSAGYLPVYMGQQRGYFAEEGLDVEVITMTGGPDVNAVLSNQAWGHIGAPERVSNALLKGGDIRIAATIANRGLVYFVARPGLEGADLAEMLKGKRIATGTLGGTPNAVTRYALRQVGLDPQRDVTLLELETPAIPPAVEKGQADIAVTQEPLIRQGVVKGMWAEPFYSAPQAIGPYLYTSFSISGRSLKTEPDVAVAFMRGLIRSFQALQEGGPLGTLPVAQAEFPTMDSADLRASLDRAFADQLWQFDGPLATISDQAFNTMVDVGMISGTFKDRIAYQDVVDPTYLDRAHASLAAR